MRSYRLENKNGNPERTNAMRKLSDRLLGKTYVSQPMKAIGPAAAVLLALAALAPAASAKTATMHLFSRATSATFVTPQGHPLPPNTRPSVGDVNDITGIDYVGNHKHHASHPTGSDHLRCTLTGLTADGAKAVCDGEIAIGGSMLLVNHESLTLPESNGPLVFRINGGTGTYRHAHGRIVATTVGNNTDFVIRVNY
jgi:hypothetical protein